MELTREPHIENLANIFERSKKIIRGRTDKPEFPFGLTELDNVTKGIKRGKLTLIASRTSEGKTGLSTQLAVNLANNGKTVCLISLEDDKEQIAEKIFCNQRRVNNYDLLRGDTRCLEDPTMKRLFEQMKLLVVDNFGYNFDEIKYIVEELDPKPDIIFIDYLQLVDRGQFRSRYDAISEFARSCKIFANQSNIGIVLTSQINRAGAREDRPNLHNMSGCDTIEEQADLALILFHPHLYRKPTYNYVAGTMEGFEQAPKNWVEIEVAKNKTGRRGVIIPVCFTGQHYLFEDWVVLP